MGMDQRNQSGWRKMGRVNQAMAFMQRADQVGYIRRKKKARYLEMSTD